MGFLDNLKKRRENPPKPAEPGPKMAALMQWLDENVKTEEDADLFHGWLKDEEKDE